MKVTKNNRDDRWRENLVAFKSISSTRSWGIPVFRFQYVIINVSFLLKPVFNFPGWAHPLFWFDYYPLLLTHKTLNSAWISLLNLRPVYPNIDWTSELGCPIGTANASYLKPNSSSLLPQPLLKLTPSHVFPVSINGITGALVINLRVIPRFPILLPPYPTGVGL